ncbi:MAG: peptidoglycan bridge formation glycyltransferase FemA/FemB family protein [Actinomycetaceae bacterium]|nr:peptidoglycan bridge formation glycyltransferase FemA/FemB family protein [Actinomycetaceae bacterium]
MADPQDLQKIEAFLKDQPFVPITQAPAWRKVKANWDCHRFTLEDDGEITAYAQVLSITDRASKNVLWYLPRGPIVAGEDPDRTIALVKQIKQAATEAGAKTLRIDPPLEDTPENREFLLNLAQQVGGGQVNFGDGNCRSLHGQPKYTMTIDLRDLDYDSWLALIRKSRRREIKKLNTRLPTTTQISRDPAHVETLYRLIEQTATRQGISYRPKEYFYNITKAFPDDFFFTAAMVEDEIVAISLNVVYGRRLWGLYAGTDVSAPTMLASTATNVEDIRYSIEHGLTHFDLGGVYGIDADDQLYRFKYGFFPKGQDYTAFVGEIEFSL